MAGRRTDAEIAAVRALGAHTSSVAHGISDRVNRDDNDDSHVFVRGFNYHGYRADSQRSLAAIIEVSYTTKDPVIAEKVARAIKAAVEAHFTSK